MKNPSRIDFKNAQKHTIYYTIKLLESLNNLSKPKDSINELNEIIYKYHNQVLNEVIRFQSERDYNLKNFKGSYQKKYAEYLMQTLPTLCLAKSERLDDLLEDLGLSENSRAFFVNKEKIDLTIEKTIASLKIDNHINPELEVLVKLLSYLIIGLRCYAQLSEEIHGLYSENRKVIRQKADLEGEIRKIKNDASLNKANSSKELNDSENSSLELFMIKAMNSTLSKNHSGSYNVSYLSSLIYSVLRKSIKNDISDDKILFELGQLFRLIYIEKNIKNSEDDLDAFDYKAKDSIGDNFRDHVVKKCKSIIGYKGSKHPTEEAARYQAGKNFDIFQFIKVFLKGLRNLFPE